MKSNMVEKMSVLTTIPEKHLTRLTEVCELAITNLVEEALLNGESVVDANLGFGTLGIKFEDNQLRFRFTPSAKFEEDLITTIKDKKSSLSTVLETSLITKIVQTYKDLM